MFEEEKLPIDSDGLKIKADFGKDLKVFPVKANKELL